MVIESRSKILGNFQLMKTKNGNIILYLIVPEQNINNITETITISDVTNWYILLFFF